MHQEVYNKESTPLMGGRDYFTTVRLFDSRLFSGGSKVKLYVSHSGSILTCKCKPHGQRRKDMTRNLIHSKGKC